ncbi:MAG: acetoacetate--CoA ligase, partial [Bacilli bacterium]|nr:acetoacetate--CoA ligase [Bacilli bacterium]
PVSEDQSFMPLFVSLREGVELSDELKKKINDTIRTKCSPRHVPNEIVEVDEIPTTLNGKKVEVPVKKILMGNPVEESVNIGSLANPKAIEFFVEYRKKLQQEG